jgi:hypothetical protein
MLSCTQAYCLTIDQFRCRQASHSFGSIMMAGRGTHSSLIATGATSLRQDHTWISPVALVREGLRQHIVLYHIVV